MFGLGFGELLVILVVVLLVFGPEKLPEIARTLGKTLAEMRRTVDDIKHELTVPRLDDLDPRTSVSSTASPSSAPASAAAGPSGDAPKPDAENAAAIPPVPDPVDPPPGSPNCSDCGCPEKDHS